MKSERALVPVDPARWFSSYPGYDADTVALFGPRTPKATFNQFKLEQAKAVAQLRAWMAQRMPSAYSAVMQQAPHLLDPQRNALAGFGQDDTDLFAVAPGADAAVSSTGAISVSTTPLNYSSTVPSTGGGPGDWASSLLNFASKAIPVAGQVQLLETNIARAKAGLPPIDPGTIAPQFNVGLSRSTMFAGGGGLLLLGAIVLGAVALAKRR